MDIKFLFKILVFIILFSFNLNCFSAGIPKVDWTYVAKVFSDHLSQPGVNVKNARLHVYDFNRKLIYSNVIGKFSVDTAVPLLSSSKWISSVTFLTLVEEGIIGLDDPVSKYIKIRKKDLKSVFDKMTIRHLLSFTAGIPDRDSCMFHKKSSLKKCSNILINKTSKKAVPGKVYSYGDAYFTMLGYIAEIVTNKKWQKIFDKRMKKPLGFKSEGKYYAKPRRPKGARNPRPAAGLRLSFADYEKFLWMLVNDGTYEGKKIISKELSRELEDNQLKKIAENNKFALPQYDTLNPISYGLGNFLVCFDLLCKDYANTSPGLNGFIPWIDKSKKYYAIIGIYEKRKLSSVLKLLQLRLMHYLHTVKLD